MQSSKRIVIVDDHALFRHGIRLLIESLKLSWELDELSSLEELNRLSKTHNVDLILLDLHLPDINLDDTLNLISSGSLPAPVIVLSADDSPSTVRRAIEHGAMSFISKASTYHKLIHTLTAVLGQQVSLPETVAAETEVGVAEKQAVVEIVSGMTERQREILWLLVQGKPNKTIGSMMNITEYTVKGHITRILSAMNVRNRTEAVYKLAASDIDLTHIPE